MGKNGAKSFMPALLGCLALQFCAGILYMWSVFSGPICAEYGWSMSSVTLTASLMVMMFVIGILAGGFIQDKTNPRLITSMGSALFCLGLFTTSLLTADQPSWMLYLTYSTLSGLGTGFVYCAVLACVQKWFPHRRGFASGLSVSAFGLSIVFFTPVAEALLARNNVSTTFRIFALIFFVIMAIACIFVRNPPEEYLAGIKMPAVVSGKMQTQESITPARALRSPKFWMMFVVTFTITGAWNIVFPLIKTLANSDFRNVPPAIAILTVMLTGIFSSAGRLIAPTASDKIGRINSLYILSLITMVACILLIFAQGMVFCIAVGMVAFAYGGPSGVFPALTMDTFGPKHFGTIYGVQMLALGMSSIFFTKVAQLLSAGGSYTTTFLVAAGVCVLAGIITFLLGKLPR